MIQQLHVHINSHVNPKHRLKLLTFDPQDTPTGFSQPRATVYKQFPSNYGKLIYVK